MDRTKPVDDVVVVSLGDEVIVLDSAAGIVHRLSGVAAELVVAGVRESDGLGRRDLLQRALIVAPLLITSMVLPSATAAASPVTEEPSTSGITITNVDTDASQITLNWRES